MSRGFEKISFPQFSVDIDNNQELYKKYKLPRRSTKNSAGYDFFAIDDIIIKPGETQKIPTGIKVYMNQDEMLMLIVRGSMGFKYNVRLCNQVGIIDSDYYNNKSNEGHLWVRLQNHGDSKVIIKKGDAYIQGIFTKFLIIDNEEKIKNERIGGFGSTNKGEENE
ncbi:MAG: deoxyuridine 5'-triphosphate nucleotidohydrolase [Bacilli bacterium]|nr:deoxyuridine 5'-triphosphate nucleotidohydrolase [Bacilli bacterium]MDD4282227.1 deoxyuridine 5'-triphosphate nucleotidohydrolase [Bacilli bacterium]MDD4718226.1 deoxyuridine 5'-triphosphate nucleotidohydrolase [Bacilli bacterium]